MDADEIRRSFADFCGTDRYRQFVAAIWRKAIWKQRLVFWQEQLWREFSRSTASALPVSFADVYRVFRVCPRHLEPLEVVERDGTSAVLPGGSPNDDRADLFLLALVAVTQRGVTEALSCRSCRSDREARTAAARAGR